MFNLAFYIKLALVFELGIFETLVLSSEPASVCTSFERNSRNRGCHQQRAWHSAHGPVEYDTPMWVSEEKPASFFRFQTSLFLVEMLRAIQNNVCEPEWDGLHVGGKDL